MASSVDLHGVRREGPAYEPRTIRRLFSAVVTFLHSLSAMPGTEVLTRLKADPITREIPVIVLTADAGGRLLERVKQLGGSTT